MKLPNVVSAAGKCPFHAGGAVDREATAAARGMDAYQPPKLDETYAKVSEIRSRHSDPQAKKAAGQVHGMLNELFYPMLYRLHETVDGLSREQLVERAAKLQAETPPQIGSYKSGRANVGFRGGVNSQYQVDHNALGGNNRFYGLSSLPSVANHFAFRRPSEAMLSELGAFQHTLGLHVTPVGEYGSELAEEMVLTTALLTQLAHEQLPAMSRATMEGNQNLLHREALRVRSEGAEGTAKGLGPLVAVGEGIVSLNQVLSNLVTKKLPGAETGRDALRSVIFDGQPRNGLTTDFTARVPIGVTAPLSMQGRGFGAAVHTTAEGKRALTQETETTLRGMFDKNRAQRTNGVCPLTSSYRGSQALSEGAAEAGTKPLEKQLSGIQLLSEDYWRVFDAVHEMRKRKPAEGPQRPE